MDGHCMRRAVAVAAFFLVPTLAAAATDRYVVALKAGVPSARSAMLLRDIDGTVQPRDRQVSEFLGGRQGDLWYELLAQAWDWPLHLFINRKCSFLMSPQAG